MSNCPQCGEKMSEIVIISATPPLDYAGPVPSVTSFRCQRCNERQEERQTIRQKQMNKLDWLLTAFILTWGVWFGAAGGYIFLGAVGLGFGALIGFYVGGIFGTFPGYVTLLAIAAGIVYMFIQNQLSAGVSAVSTVCLLVAAVLFLYAEQLAWRTVRESLRPTSPPTNDWVWPEDEGERDLLLWNREKAIAGYFVCLILASGSVGLILFADDLLARN